MQNCSQNLKQDSRVVLQDEDTSLLLIRYKKVLGEKIPFGSSKAYLTPKIWDRLFDEDKKNYFTFKPGEYDFFAEGNFINSEKINYETFKNSHDDVFLIHGVKDFDSDLLHWEIEGY